MKQTQEIKDIKSRDGSSLRCARRGESHQIKPLLAQVHMSEESTRE